MRPSLYHLLTCLLLVATGLAFLGLGASLSASRLTFPAARSNTALAFSFYEVVNRVLATGDPAPLVAVASPSFAVHGLLPAGSADLAAFGEYLVALHAAFPDLRVDVTELVAAREVVMTRVTVQSGATGALAGLPISAPVGLWGAADSVRIAGDRVGELWSSGGAGAEVRTLFAAPAAIESGTIAKVDRFRLAGELDLAAITPLLLYLEKGTLDVSVVDPGRGEGRPPRLPSVVAGGSAPVERPSHAIAPGGVTTLQPGDLLMVWPHTVFRLGATNGQPAAGVVIELLSPVAPDPAVFMASSAQASMAASALAPLPTDPLMQWELLDSVDAARQWTAGSMVLGPGASLTVGEVPGVALLSVEAGTLSLTAEAGEVMAQANATVPNAVVMGPQAALGVGASALLRPGTRATLRNAGEVPVTVLVIAAVVGASD